MSIYRISSHSPKEKRVIKSCESCKQRLQPHEQTICNDCRRKQQLRMRGY
ncbi:hypothetical protein HYP99_gp007 [Sinorhizobium phage ort11]|uniref:Uncharacterized protein n=1 Tax=Sinorhizobium phage ort11 TaxID=2599764 RepID=A0A5C2H3M5_9CAUD|nr:hypothetical protein HYP99_gp007 [Sinorhizobium phage ort11]QEP29805.1 hypothetical protein Smphiort11_007 [Sinorhizobium phage ort11]